VDNHFRSHEFGAAAFGGQGVLDTVTLTTQSTRVHLADVVHVMGILCLWMLDKKAESLLLENTFIAKLSVRLQCTLIVGLHLLA
jgi:hypothetical protein